MRDYAREAIAMMDGKTRVALDTDRQLTLALTRLLEIIGEAATRVPEVRRELLPAVPWRQIIALRNRLIHGYDAVDSDVLWHVLKRDLPALVEDLQ